jgi:ribosomal protein S3
MTYIDIKLIFYYIIATVLKMSAQISKKRKFVADGVFRAELNEFFTRELAEEGYSGCDVRVTHARTEVLSIGHVRGGALLINTT